MRDICRPILQCLLLEGKPQNTDRARDIEGFFRRRSNQGARVWDCVLAFLNNDVKFTVSVSRGTRKTSTAALGYSCRFVATSRTYRCCWNEPCQGGVKIGLMIVATSSWTTDGPEVLVKRPKTYGGLRQIQDTVQPKECTSCLRDVLSTLELPLNDL